MKQMLFSKALPELEWTEFQAEGYSEPAVGVIHSSDSPAVCGMPIGSIDTGCIDLETDGTLGYCTMFNSHVPRRGPVNLPFLGLSLGSESWVLSSKKIHGYNSTAPGTTELRRGQRVNRIYYWGHYPIADLEFDIDVPLSIGMRAWSPFIPGDVAISNTPGAVFEVHLCNASNSIQNGKLVFSFPGPSPLETIGINNFKHTKVTGSFSGVAVSNENGVEYAIGVTDNENVNTGGDLGIDGGLWSNIITGLPAEVGQAGASVSVDFQLKENEQKVIRFILAWYCPQWKSGGTPMSESNTFTHMYASRYKNSLEVANLLAEKRQPILERIIAWQQVIYTEKQLPIWLRESLVNILHLITEDSFWAQAKPPIGDWCKPEDGLFGMNECPRGCPQIECIPCSFYGNIPLVYFFPELALSTLRGYKVYQYPDGAAPWIFGGCTSSPPTPPCEMAMPTRGYGHKPQTTLDGPCYVDMVDRLWLRSDNDEILREFYESVKKNTQFTMNLRPESGAAGLVSMPSGNNGQDWFESCDLFGIVPHIGGVHLANLRMAERMAEAIGDKEFAKQCREWFKQGSEVMEAETWNGEYYDLYSEPETGRKSDTIMGYQLDGEWMSRFHGLPGVFGIDRVQTTLATLKQTNMSERGALVFRLKDNEFGTGYWTSSGVHVPGSLMLAMTYMYHGDKEFGLELARRSIRSVVIESRSSWDFPILIDSDNGERIWGNDYYQNLMLWSLPAALDGDDLAEPCKSGGLVNRIISVNKKH
jgi:non-lysosomal glucosylceramidase